MRYTLAITSCNRHGLLQRTLDSFIAKADIMPDAVVIVEDSDRPKPEWIKHPKYAHLGRSKWISNGGRYGQIYSLDKLYDEVDTEYVFHCEDDWEFTRGGFMARSFDILEKYPLISNVSLRGNDCNGHPLTKDLEYPFQIQARGWQKGWGGYAFNPGLRRMSDLKRFGGSFGLFAGYGKHGCGHELEMSKRMLEWGYSIAVLDVEPHVRHIGGGLSKAIEPLPAAPRILLAVPVSRSYNYGAHHCGLKRVTAGRIPAVRETWFRDAKRFPNVDARFFYGLSGYGAHRLQDEVDLEVPDDYTALPQKVKAICAYARDNGYDFLVKADDDTALHVDRLLRSGFDQVDQMGYFPCKHPRCNCYITGMCYTLSRKAFTMAAGAPLIQRGLALAWAEDYWMGGLMRTNGLTRKGHSGWVTGANRHYAAFPFPRNTVAAHSVEPETMRKWYASLPR